MWRLKPPEPQHVESGEKPVQASKSKKQEILKNILKFKITLKDQL